MTLRSEPFANIDVCASDEIADGGARIFKLPVGQQEICVLVLRSGADYFSYLNRCPHFGVPLAAADAQLIFQSNHWIKCNVHYAKFRWRDGFCESGDCAGESLEILPLDIKNGTIRIQLPNIDFAGQE